MAEMIRVVNTHNGQVGWVLRRHFEHPAFNKYLVEYTDKAPVAKLFKSRDPETFVKDQEKKTSRKADDKKVDTPEQGVETPENKEN